MILIISLIISFLVVLLLMLVVAYARGRNKHIDLMSRLKNYVDIQKD